MADNEKGATCPFPQGEETEQQAATVQPFLLVLACRGHPPSAMCGGAAGARAIPGERFWGETQDMMSCRQLCSADSSGTCSRHRAAALPEPGSGQPRERYSGRAAGSICLAWISLCFCPSNGGFWLSASAGARTEKNVAERHLHRAGSGRSSGYDSITFFGRGRDGEAQLTRPAPRAALSCLTSPLGTWLKFWQNMGGRSQGLDECAARIWGGAGLPAVQLPPKTNTFHYGTGTLVGCNANTSLSQAAGAAGICLGTGGSGRAACRRPWLRGALIPAAPAAKARAGRQPGDAGHGRDAAAAGSCRPGGAEEKGRGGVWGFC